MRAGFVTCVELGKACIETVLEMGGAFEVIVTLEDSLARRKSGRVFLDDLAHAHGCNLVKVSNINDMHAVEHIRTANLDILFIIGWSQIARSEILELPRVGVFGMHPTLLPIGRGRASIPWAILKDLPATGVTLFKLDAGIDTGPVMAQEVVPIGLDETATTLYEKVTNAHVALMARAWQMMVENDIPLTPQDETRASIWPGRTPPDGQIHPNIMTVREIDRLVRATTHPYPGAFSAVSESQVLRVWAGARHVGPIAEAVEIPAIDGTYYATSYEYEDVRQALKLR